MNENDIEIISIEALTIDEVKPLDDLDPTKTRLVVTADWHIRIRPDIPEDWQLLRYRGLFFTIICNCIMYDATLVLAGDILDRNRPSLQELNLLMEFLSEVNSRGITTYLISGNHENLGQGASTYDYLQTFLSKLENVHYNSSNEIFVPLENNVDLYMVGHPALATYEHSELRKGKANILVSHFRPTVNQFIQEEIDVVKFIAPYSMTVAGDIHMPLKLYDARLMYTNHPINSCYEADPDCSFLLLEADGTGIRAERKCTFSRNLISIKTTAADYVEPEVVEDNEDFYRIEVTGSPEELRKITTDKWYIKLLKVPEVISEYVADTTEVTKIVNFGGKLYSVKVPVYASLEESLQSYMQSLNMDEETIGRMMTVFNEVE